VHLAANADVRFGWDDPERDLRQNVVLTHRILEAARREGVTRFVFSSTGSVYGEAAVIPTPEDCPFPVQTSLYGASKLAAEGLIQAYAEGAQLHATIFRFVSVLGPRYTHGHVIDFVRALRQNPRVLRILGDGMQRKSYLNVRDCVDAIVMALGDDRLAGAFNLGVDDSCRVTESARWICERLGVDPEFEFTGGDRGWIGDNPCIHLDPQRMQSLGWQPTASIRSSVEHTVDWLLAEPWVLDLPDARMHA
jgi:UDP-glucose 4-epimerase